MKDLHPTGGTELIYIDGQWYSKHDIDYLKSQSSYDDRVKNPTQKKIESSSTSHAGFSKGKKTTDILPEDNDPVEAQKQRLTLLKNNEARLVKELEGIRRVIKIVEESI